MKENIIMTIGDMKIVYDSGLYYVKHATTDKLIAVSKHKAIANRIATNNSDYKGDPRNRD